jgi:hypothetical protein
MSVSNTVRRAFLVGQLQSTPAISPMRSGACSRRCSQQPNWVADRVRSTSVALSMGCSISCVRAVPGVWALLTPRLRPVVHGLDGLITNDKFCWTRWNALSLSWPRSHPLPRTWRQDPPGAEYAPPGDRMSRHHRGGRYASSPHAPMAPAPSASSSPRRTTALGSRVSVSAAVDSALNADPVRARTGGGRPS